MNVESPRAAFYIEADLMTLRAEISAVPVTDLGMGIDQRSAVKLLDAMLAGRTAAEGTGGF
jgi:hypothetical protein